MEKINLKSCDDSEDFFVDHIEWFAHDNKKDDLEIKQTEQVKREMANINSYLIANKIIYSNGMMVGMEHESLTEEFLKKEELIRKQIKEKMNKRKELNQKKKSKKKRKKHK